MENKLARLPPLRALRAFQVAGRHLSLKDAAAELFISASAVSHQVRNLESFLGLELFERKTRSLEFTDAGSAYFAFLDEMFSRLESETHQLRSEYGRTVVRLCVPPFFANELLLPRLNRFHDIAPGTDIRLTTQPSMMKVHAVDSDVSVLLGNGEWPGLQLHRLFQHKLVMACSPVVKNQLKGKGMKKLDGQTLIVHENRPEAWDKWVKAMGSRPPRAAKTIRFDSMSSLIEGAIQGLGIALVSWPLSKRWFQQKQLVKVFKTEVASGEDFYIAYRPDENKYPNIELAIDWMRDEFSGYN